MPLEYFHPLWEVLDLHLLPPPPPLSLLCLCFCVCGEEKTKKKRVNVIMKFMYVCMSVPHNPHLTTTLPCCQYVKRCLCASSRHLRALWESRVNDASMIFCRNTHTYTVYDTCRCCCCYFAFISCLKVRKKTQPKPRLGKYVSVVVSVVQKEKSVQALQSLQTVITALTAS